MCRENVASDSNTTTDELIAEIKKVDQETAAVKVIRDKLGKWLKTRQK